MYTYKEDKIFLEKQLSLIELSDASGSLLIAPELQGRVLTSTIKANGLSFGWLNRPLIASKEPLPHCNNWGGEDRFWLGPEGGQYSLFFSPSAKDYSFDNWQTPSIIDTESWELVEKNNTSAKLQTEAQLTNHSGTIFHCLLQREIKLETTDIQTENLKAIRFSTKNTITNIGKQSWDEQTGMPSIWILGQYNPSSKAKIIIPIQTESKEDVNENYFGKIGSERLRKTATALLFSADGKKRGKIGIPPSLSCSIAGAYDAENNILTYIEFDSPSADAQYVNSMWEHQAHPFKGDVINAYNDGPLEDGSIMGPFFELESSSPAARLNPGESICHIQYTTHLMGDKESLQDVVRDKLRADINDIF